MATTEDYESIRRLIYRYPELVDAGDIAAVAKLFSRAVIKSNVGSFQGEGLLRETWDYWLRRYEGGRPFTQHVISNVSIEIAETRDAATARSYFTVLQARPELPLQVIMSGRYHDGFARDCDGWYFIERTDITDLVGDTTFHTAEPFEADP
jgi:ketosteroid isomerase-like protein